MKYLLFLFSILLIGTACENNERFASTTEGELETQASETPEYKEDLQSLVQAEVEEPKVGAKKRNTIDVVETVGDKQLHEEEEELILTEVDMTDVIMEEPVKAEPEVVALEKLDILFYMHKRDSVCVQTFRRFQKQKDFIAGLNPLDWQMSFLYYSQSNETYLLPLELQNGKAHDVTPLTDFNFTFDEDYVMSKGEYSANKTEALFLTTLEDYEARGRNDFDVNATANANKYVANPLSGLDFALSSETNEVTRKGAKKVVLLFGYDFPYYSSTEWKNFFKKHKNVHVIAIAKRDSNVSNFLHVLESKKSRFEFLPACSGTGLLEAIHAKFNQ